jgi:putative ABC transport system permease protein
LSLVAGIASFAIGQSERWFLGLAFAAFILGVFGFLWVLANVMMTLAKNYFRDSWPYVWRQGLANLYRPENQTVTLIVSVGLGTFLIVTIYLSREMLLQQIKLRSQENEPNMVLFDVQADQKADLARLIRGFDLHVYKEVPIVTMRLAAVKGRRVEEIRSDPRSDIPAWALRREYRSTYRDHLVATETLRAGTWNGNANSSDRIMVSLEHGIAEALNVTLGDELVFDIQGIPVNTRVASIREVDWQRVQPNFFVVFPTGVLEDAPQFYVLVTRTPSTEVSARLQRAVIRDFPNVSAIDLTLILGTVEAILSKVSLVLHWIAFFSVATGLTVLGGAVATTKSQRLKDSVLLRTLGASRSQILKITIAEYLFLGSFAALAGLLLAVIASWGLAFYFFAAIPAPSLALLGTALLLVTGLTVMAGMSGCRGIFHRPPLETLRAEIQ